MTATPSPSPFQPADGFNVMVIGGEPPYTYTPRLSPPNPPGVTMSGNHVNVAGSPPSGTAVIIVVTDSTQPTAQQTTCIGYVV